jgi:quinol monooxygenase YgiN
MPQQLLTVIAEIAAKPGKREELRARLVSMVEPTRAEQGCVQYDLHESNSEPGRFFFLETWASGEMLDRHLASPHLKAFAAAAPDLLAEPLRVVRASRIV